MKLNHWAWALALLPLPALAHNSAAHLATFSHGIVHPVFAWDHLLVLLATAACLGLAKPSQVKPHVLAFAQCMAAGCALGFGLGGLEWIMAVSFVSTMGFALWQKPSVRQAAWLGLCVIGAGQGALHGSELASVSAWPFAAGLVVSSALLMAAATFAFVVFAQRGYGHVARAVAIVSAALGLALAAL